MFIEQIHENLWMFFHKAYYFLPFLWVVYRVDCFSSFFLNSLVNRCSCNLFFEDWFLSPEHSRYMFHCFSLWIDLIKLLPILFLTRFQGFWLKGHQVQKSFSVVLSNHLSNDLLMSSSLWFRNCFSVHLSLHAFMVQAAFGVLRLI